ncbi:serine protease SP24D-like [Toxorhynchites rutilus septentrionalis]|uniref:serine protease SP24D-like n=1 Tax=Toxorhynchites rutilus septentrionalis TaxID=329112 RepID=UPI0024785E66|nr:serine protease SP24D-like [Toxorhynchites rutilus septentrionalis]
MFVETVKRKMARGDGILYFLLGISLVNSAERNFIRLQEARSMPPFTGQDSARIVGGTAASVNQFPHQVALLRRNSLFCGGSLISDKWVLSAAHCVYSGNQVVEPSSITVLAGTIDLTQGGVRRNVQRITPHESYGNFRNDIALLQLEQAYQLGGSIQTISLHHSEVPAGSSITISGWGRLYANGPLPSVLQYNQVTAISNSQCVGQTGITDGLICLKSPVDNGACNGDSGGPAVYNNQLVGVANFVINYCGSSAPDGYAKVSHFVKWIESKMNL